MNVLTIRSSEKEKTALAKRVKAAGLSSGALDRAMIRDNQIITAADLLKEIDSMMGNQDLRIKKSR
jgi:hypothetical protein